MIGLRHSRSSLSIFTTVPIFLVAVVLSISALQSPDIFSENHMLGMQFGLVFAQSEEPTVRFSDASGNPVFNEPGFTSEVVAEGLELPTTMAFLSQNDILVLEKDKGTVRRVVDGVLQPQPLLDVNIAGATADNERCMCGIAVSQNNETGKTNVFLYYTEAEGEDGGSPIGNRLYKYELVSDGSTSQASLTNPQLLLDLPALPGPRHNGGAITIGPDGNIYVPIGDSDKVDVETQAQNEPDVPVDGSGGILRVTQDGEPVPDPATGEYILGDESPLNLYYAYGVRNSFGIDFDPVTGNLWDSENGPGHSDEINLVEPGFNSGWNQIMGVWERGGGDPRNGDGTRASAQPEGLVDFDGRGHYHPPQLTWVYTIGPTGIKFLDSDKYGAAYQNDLFLGTIHAGYLYHFKLNEDRTDLLLPEPLLDGMADTDAESITEPILFASGFGGISDLEVSPYDGYMYVVSLGQGKIFKILPTEELDLSASAGTSSLVPLSSPDRTVPSVEEVPSEDIDEEDSTDGSDSDEDNNNNNEDDNNGNGNGGGNDGDDDDE